MKVTCVRHTGFTLNVMKHLEPLPSPANVSEWQDDIGW